MADSYNELFGIGSHSEDASLEGWWLLDDDAASTTVVDASSNGRDGTLDDSGATTADISTTGPGGFLPNALDLNFGSGDNLELVADASWLDAATGLTVLLRVNLDVQGDNDVFVSNWDGSGDGHILFRQGSGGRLEIFVNDTTQTGGNVIPSATLGTGSGWQDVSARWNGTVIRGGIDGTYAEISAGGSALSSTANNALWLGGSPHAPSGDFTDGQFADASIFSRYLTDAEEGQWRAGPEPTYTSGASLDEDGNYSVGTWDSHSNGTATYVVSAVNAAGDVLGSDTTATGTIDISEESGNTVYLVVRASNDGGYDVGDYATRTSGFGSAGDGYYEIDSVVAAGGGGGPDYTITQSAAASVEVSGLTGSLVVARNVTQSAPAAIEVAGLSGSLEVSRSLTQSSPAAVVVEGLAGSLSVGRQITQSAPAAVEVSGLEGSLTYSEEGGPTYTLTQTAPAAVEVAGLSGSLAVSRQIIQSAPASVEVEGQDGTLTLAYQLSQSATADVEVSGLAGSLIVARRIVQSAAAGISVQGRAGTLTYSEEVDTPTTVTGNYAAVAAPQNAGAVAAPQNYQAVAAPQNYAAVQVGN